MEIPKLKTIQVTSSLLVIWALLDVADKYSFTNSEKEFISQINEIGNTSVLDKKLLYKYGLYVCSLAGELQGVDKAEITKLYNDMAIHNKLDIALRPVEICEILQKEPGNFLREIISDLEDKLLSGIVKNDKDDIKEYILDVYSENAI